MLRVLTLSTLFPHRAQPTLGVFVERQVLGLAALDDVEVEVVSPVGLPPWPLAFHPHYNARRKLPRSEVWKGLLVHRPRFPVLPRIGEERSARAMADALLPVLRDLRRRFPFDLIDAQFFWPDGPAAMHLAGALGVPFSIKARGSDIHYWADRPGIGGQILAAGRKADGLLAVSAALKADMVALGMPEERIRVHRTGVDLDAFRPVDRAAARAGLGVTGPLIATAGALIPRKGQRTVLAALRELPGATLIAIGDGPDRKVLEPMADALGVADRVRFLGNRPHAELPALLAAADVMVLASESEGLANVWVESLACGTPIVTGDVGGAREVLDRPEAGRLAPLQSGPIAAAIREILGAPPAQDAVREAARRFSWERNALELRAHLGALVEGFRRAA